MSAAKQHTNAVLFDFFRSRLDSLSRETAIKYRRTLTELYCFLSGHGLNLADADGVMIADWTAEMLRHGLSPKTVTGHLNILNSLLNNAVGKGLLSQADDSARRLARRLQAQPLATPLLMNESIFTGVATLIKNAATRIDATSDDSSSAAAEPTEPASASDTADLLLFSLMGGAMPLMKVAMLRKSDIDNLGRVPRLIARHKISPRRDFIFDLRQSYLTPRQLEREVRKRVGEFLAKTVPADAFADADMFVRSLWVAAAMRCGATASEALGALGIAPSDVPLAIPDFCGAGENRPDKADEWSKAVNALFRHEPPGWYAMQMRRGVDYDTLRSEIAEAQRPVPELFYPCETIRRNTRGKTVLEDRPFITGTVFFRSDPANVLPLFRRIGDKAWCYRMNGAPGAPYAVISGRDMRRFQQAVGIFTPDIEVHPLGSLQPRPGERVVLIAAGYAGLEAEVEEVVSAAPQSVIIRVRLTTDQGYEWRLNVDSRQLRRLTEN